MATIREIYQIRFNKVPVEKDILSTVYTVGQEVAYYGRGMKCPAKICYTNKIKKDRLIVSFTDGTYHEIGITPEVEIFWKDTEVPDKPKNPTKKKRCKRTRK